MSSQKAKELEAHAQRRVGQVLRGKYRLDSVLGMGGMAVVYKATHRNKAEFAVKLLHEELSLREEVRARFLREGYAANTVKHPGVVLVVDDDLAEDGAAFLVMELLDGMGCQELAKLHGGKVPPSVASAIGHALLDVLSAAHANGVIHRDLKPANMFVTRDGRLKVLDFGIARVRDAAATSVTASGVLLGTPGFMGPEQSFGRTSDIDARTDIWAVGATLFTLLSGEMVHRGESPQEVLVKSATQPARSLAEVAPAVPAPIVEIVGRALAFRREDRWPDAASMRDALAAAHRTLFREPPSPALLAQALKGPSIAMPESRPAPVMFGASPVRSLVPPPAVPAPPAAAAPEAVPRTHPWALYAALAVILAGLAVLVVVAAR